MARLLDQASYGALISLVSLANLVVLLAGTFQTVVARFVASAHDAAGARHVLAVMLCGLAPAALLLTAAVALFSGPLAAFLRLDERAALLILAPTLGLALLVPLLRGAAQGRQAFGVLAALLVLDAALRLAGGAAFVRLGLGIDGAVLALLVGLAAGAALGWWWLPRGLPPVDTKTDSRLDSSRVWRFTVPALLANGGVYAMVVLDAVLVKHYFAPEAAASFAALSVAGRSLFWGCAAVALVLLPVVSRREALGHRSGHAALWWGLGIAAALAGAGELVFAATPGVVVRLLFGERYFASAPLLPLYGLGTAALTLANVALHYLLARGRTAVVAVAPLCALAQIAAVALWHANLTQVTLALVAADATLFVLSLVLALVPPRSR